MKALLKKITALVISAVMITSLLPIMEHTAMAESVPDFKVVYRTEDFEDGVFGEGPGHIYSYAGSQEGGECVEENGKGSIKRNGSDGRTEMRIRVNGDYPYTETALFKFTLSKTGDAPAFFNFYPFDYAAAKWTRDRISIAYRESASELGSDAVFHELPGSYTGDVEFLFWFDVAKSRFSCWINGEMVLQNVYSRAVDTSGNHHIPEKIEELRMYTESGEKGDLFSVDDIKSGLPEDIKILADLDEKWLTLKVLTGFDTNYILNDLHLPTIGENGSTITWESDNEDIISINGKVTNPQNGMELVTLTAKISAQNITNIKEFDMKVFSKQNDDEQIAQLDVQLISKDMLTPQDKLTHNLELPREGFLGQSELSWTSSCEDVISNDGVVIRPSKEEGDKNVTLTVTAKKGDKTSSKELDFVVLAKSSPLDVVEILEEDDFNSDKISDKWTLEKASGELYQENGCLHFIRTSNSGSTSVSCDFNGTYTGLIGVDFTLTKVDDNGGFEIRVDGGGAYLAMTLSGTVVSICSPDTPSSGAAWISAGSVSDTKRMDVTVLFDTDKSQYTVFINGSLITKNRYARSGTSVTAISNFKIYMDQGTSEHARIDDYRVYRALPLEENRLDYDFNWLNEQLLGDEAISGEIKNNLNLPTKGYCGSDITWRSTDSSIISTNGIVNRPSGNEPDDKTVTLNAKISYKNSSRYKSFTFRVLREFTDDEQKLSADLNLIESNFGDYLTSENFDEITKSLNFDFKTKYGSRVKFTSSNTNAVTNSGRVIRPREGEASQETDITMTLSSGDKSVTRVYHMTVLPDSTFIDPQYMTDEEFFGKWNVTGWETVGKFDYDNVPELSKIEGAVKSGDYSAAKVELLEFVRNKEPIVNLGKDIRNPVRANAHVDGIFGTPYAGFAQGEFTAEGEEWETYSIDILKTDYTAGHAETFKLMGWYNESSMLETKSRESGEGPELELVVNGKIRKYKAVEDATIRAGAYKAVPDKNEEVLYSSTYGELMSDSTYQSLIKFKLDDITTDDIITGARLVVKARVTGGGESQKRMLVVYEKDSTWKEGGVSWNSLLGFFYNFNSVGYTWNRVYGDDIEVMYQNCRMPAYPAITMEYIYSKDEKYAYGVIREMEDFIKKKGNFIVTNKTTGETTRGQYPRTLDTAERNESWLKSIVPLSASKYMTPEAITAIYKHIWDMNHSYTVNRSNEANWVQNEMTRLYTYSPALSEFTESSVWTKMAQDILLPLIFNNNFSDGSYIEGTLGYNANAMNQFIQFKKTAEERGIEVGEEYNKMLLKAAYYNRLMFTPDGREFQWGDSGLGNSSNSVLWPDIYRWYNDKEFEYITTYGKSGTEPDWTSKVFYDNRTATMRSSWSRDALFLFTNVRGGGWHSNGDDNHVFISAYSRPLLTDSGIMSYTGGTPEKNYAVATIGHNTVEINGTSQLNVHFNNMDGKDYRGSIDEWVTGKTFDFLSQTAVTYPKFKHKRTIMFVKPYYYIVSDYMAPDDKNTINTYKQLWHMLPEAQLSIDENTKQIKSNFSSGANVIVASADNVITETGDGWFDPSYGQIYEIKHGDFYQKVKGDATFDTVIVPSRNDPAAKLESERLDIGVPTTTATALKFKSTADSAENTGYYYLSYEKNPTATRQFDKFSSNGEMAFVNEIAGDGIKVAALKNASFIKQGEKYVVDTGKAFNDLSLTMQGHELEVVTSETDLSKLRISASCFNLHTLSVNGEKCAFKIKDDYIYIDKDGKVQESDDIKKGGSLTGGSSGNPSEPQKPSPSPGPSHTGNDDNNFTDVPKDHWAKKEIESLFKNGIINGKSEHIFEPDSEITRAEFVALIIRSFGESEEKTSLPFNDVPEDAWYAPYVQTALRYGLISEDKLFRPNDNITREEVAKIMVNTVGLKEKISVPDEFNLSFRDTSDISDWAKEYVRGCAYLKLVVGDENGKFNPKNSLTRAETAMIIFRYLNNR